MSQKQNNPTQENVNQEEVSILLGAIEIMRKEILSTVADAHGSIVSSVNEQMRNYRDGVLTRYGIIPSKKETTPKQPIDDIENIEEQPIETQPIEETPLDETKIQKPEDENLGPTEIVVKDDVPTKETVTKEPEKQESAKPNDNAKDMLPKDFTNRLKEVQWFKTANSDYLIRSVDMFDPDIKVFWMNVLGDKEESEILTFEGFAYQVVVGKEKSLWLRKWTEDQIKDKQKPTN